MKTIATLMENDIDLPEGELLQTEGDLPEEKSGYQTSEFQATVITSLMAVGFAFLVAKGWINSDQSANLQAYALPATLAVVSFLIHSYNSKRQALKIARVNAHVKMFGMRQGSPQPMLGGFGSLFGKTSMPMIKLALMTIAGKIKKDKPQIAAVLNAAVAALNELE